MMTQLLKKIKQFIIALKTAYIAEWFNNLCICY